MTTDSGLQAAVDGFYEALNTVYTGDAGPMSALWSDAPYVSAFHSLGDKEAGGAEVRAEWDRVASRVEAGEVAFEPLRLHANGDLGYAAGVERGSVTVGGQRLPVDVRVTNVFEREGGTWKVIHHHADTAVAIKRAIG